MIHHGDLFDVLPTLPAQSVHCVVTSPPYWGLRDYGNPPRTFPDGWTGCLGLEPTPELFVAHMVQAFAEVHRVLRDDGTLWLNIGDCYSQSGRGGNPDDSPHRKQATNAGSISVGRGSQLHAGLHEKQRQAGVLSRAWSGAAPEGYKPKDLVGIPWLLAFALRSAGWYLRAEIIWAKGVSFCDNYAGSVMPESVQDRPTRSHEQVFLLTKSPRYFYDAEAVREAARYPKGPNSPESIASPYGQGFTRAAKEARKKDLAGVRGPASERTQSGEFQNRWDSGNSESRNLRTVWTISPKPFTEAHFATFPPDLVIPCIKAGTSEKGVCALCGAPWRRLVEKEAIPDDVRADFEAARQRSAEDHGREDGFTTRRPNFQRGRGATTWEPTCEHADAEIVPAVVMDCFSGAGTVGAVCAGLHRRYVGVEINPAYIAIAEHRIAAVAPLFAEGNLS